MYSSSKVSLDHAYFGTSIVLCLGFGIFIDFDVIGDRANLFGRLSETRSSGIVHFTFNNSLSTLPAILFFRGLHFFDSS